MEATVVVVDNSEWTRNGDFPPTRFQAQADAVNLLAGAKTQAHPENAVGVMTSSGAAPRVLVTPTPDLGLVLNAVASVRQEGAAPNLAAAVQVAALALKHRANKNQRQRVVVFVGSPVAEASDALVRIAKKLKKNNVAVDVVLFGGEGEGGGGEGETTEAKLEAFRAAADSGGNSHLVAVPPGAILADALFGTPIFQQGDDDFGGGGGGGGGGGDGGGGGGGGGGFEFGVDPSLDPELAMALRVSMEEERARQAAAAAAEGGGGGGEGSGAAADASAAPAAAAAAAAGEAEPMDEDALLQQALALSMADAAGGGGAAAPSPAAGAAAAPPPPGDDDEDEQLKLALAMSMADAGGAGASAAAAPGDESYLASVVASLPGVDADDPAVRDAVRRAAGGDKEEEPKKE